MSLLPSARSCELSHHFLPLVRTGDKKKTEKCKFSRRRMKNTGTSQHQHATVLRLDATCQDIPVSGAVDIKALHSHRKSEDCYTSSQARSITGAC